MSHRLVNAAVVGEGWRLLGPDEVIQSGDQTGLASLLMSVRHFEPWSDVWATAIGETVAEALDGDGDAKERLFRRRT